MNRLRWLVAPAALLALAFAGAAQAMTIDGRLDEPEWAQAQSFSDFRVTEPLTRATPPHATELLVLPLPDALYVGLRAEHPAALRTHGRSPRDAPNMDADPAILLIDFEGRGKTAYEFTVTLSGTVRDSIILNQTELSTDWDADWTAVTHEDDAGWSAEWRIPWSTAPEGSVHDFKRTIGVYAGRFVKREAVRYAFPAIELLGPNFVRDFKRIEVPHFSASTLDVYPYASVTHDTQSVATRGRAGFDVFWKPNGQNQVSLAVNPDFGQVESDDLVINLNSIETFFQEKRPFFTQGQQLFNLGLTVKNQLPNDGLVYTRRIGAAPDAGDEGASDVLAAAKYTGISGEHEYGLFGAAERESSLARGRDFLVGRWRLLHEDFSVGYLGTATLHPTLHRDAFVHDVDFNWRPSPGMAFTSQVLMSDIHAGADSTRGLGWWSKFDYQPGGRWEHELVATWFDRKLDFNDLGYQQRTDLIRLQTVSALQIRHYRDGSLADSGAWQLALTVPYNTSGERLVALAEFGHQFQWRSGANSYFVYVHEMPGYDDLLTRGNGSLRMPSRHNWGADYQSAVHGRFRYYVGVFAREQGFTSYTKELKFQPKYFVTDNLSLGLNLDYYDSPNWLVWVAGREVGVYRRHELVSNFNANWYPAPRQELRLRMQWAGLGATARAAYELAPDGRPELLPTLPQDFTVSTVGLQLRYRYEFHPLSDLYVVYSRGGDGSLDDREESLRNQFDRAWQQVDTSLLFVKLRYRI